MTMRSRVFARLFALSAALLSLASTVALPSATAEDGLAGGLPLPLGPAGLAEQRTSMELAPGLVLTRINRGNPDPASGWTVTAAWEETESAAQATAARVTAAGFTPTVLRVDQRAPDDPASGPLGYAVRVGTFATLEAATPLRGELVAAGFSGAGVDFTGEDGGATSGPWSIDVLRVEHARFGGALRSALPNQQIAAGKSRLSQIVTREAALAGVNGGYFVVGPTDGTPGDAAGIAVHDGALVSEAVNGRTALFLEHGTRPDAPLARVLSSVSTSIQVTASDSSQHVVNGLDRVPGLERACGVPGAMPTELPKHDFTCTDPNELILYRPIYGTATPAGEGVEAALSADGRVGVLRPRGGRIPLDGAVLAGSGVAADWLAAHAQPGARLRVTERLATEAGRVQLESGLDVVNGGPRLLRDGQPQITACAEGFCYGETGRFYWRFGVRRNPRTMAGTTDVKSRVARVGWAGPHQERRSRADPHQQTRVPERGSAGLRCERFGAKPSCTSSISRPGHRIRHWSITFGARKRTARARSFPSPACIVRSW